MLAAGIANVLVDQLIITPDHRTIYQILLGVTAIVGHIFPIFAGFRGGKGVATMVGIILTVQLELAMACAGIFFAVVLFSHYVSLASIVASLMFPVLMMFPEFEPGADDYTIAMAFSIFLIVVITHRENIRRLLDGNERKSYLVPKKVKVG